MFHRLLLIHQILGNYYMLGAVLDTQKSRLQGEEIGRLD